MVMERGWVMGLLMIWMEFIFKCVMVVAIDISFLFNIGGLF